MHARLFASVDTDGNGTISKNELRDFVLTRDEFSVDEKDKLKEFLSADLMKSFRLMDDKVDGVQDSALDINEWKATWECKLGNPKLLWSLQYADGIKNDKTTSNGKMSHANAAAWVKSKNTNLNEVNLLKWIEDNSVDMYDAGFVGFNNLFDAIPPHPA